MKKITSLFMVMLLLVSTVSGFGNARSNGDLLTYEQFKAIMDTEDNQQIGEMLTSGKVSYEVLTRSQREYQSALASGYGAVVNNEVNFQNDGSYTITFVHRGNVINLPSGATYHEKNSFIEVTETTTFNLANGNEVTINPGETMDSRDGDIYQYGLWVPHDELRSTSRDTLSVDTQGTTVGFEVIETSSSVRFITDMRDDRRGQPIVIGRIFKNGDFIYYADRNGQIVGSSHDGGTTQIAITLDEDPTAVDLQSAIPNQGEYDRTEAEHNQAASDMLDNFHDQLNAPQDTISSDERSRVKDILDGLFEADQLLHTGAFAQNGHPIYMDPAGGVYRTINRIGELELFVPESGRLLNVNEYGQIIEHIQGPDDHIVLETDLSLSGQPYDPTQVLHGGKTTLANLRPKDRIGNKVIREITGSGDNWRIQFEDGSDADITGIIHVGRAFEGERVTFARRDADGNVIQDSPDHSLTQNSGNVDTDLPDPRANDFAANTDNIDYLRRYAQDTDPVIRSSVVRNPNTPPNILKTLAQDSSDAIRAAVASHQNSDSGVLEILYQDPNPEIRVAVAQNPRAMTPMLLRLAYDESDVVRAWVATNPNTPESSLNELATDSNEEVRFGVAENIRTPPETLVSMANSNNPGVWQNLAKNSNTPAAALLVLSTKNAIDLNYKIAHHPNAPIEALENILQSDLAEETGREWRATAQAALNSKRNEQSGQSNPFEITFQTANNLPGALNAQALGLNNFGEDIGDTTYTIGDVFRKPDGTMILVTGGTEDNIGYTTYNSDGTLHSSGTTGNIGEVIGASPDKIAEPDTESANNAIVRTASDDENAPVLGDPRRPEGTTAESAISLNLNDVRSGTAPTMMDMFFNFNGHATQIEAGITWQSGNGAFTATNNGIGTKGVTIGNQLYLIPTGSKLTTSGGQTTIHALSIPEGSTEERLTFSYNGQHVSLTPGLSWRDGTILNPNGVEGSILIRGTVIGIEAGQTSLAVPASMMQAATGPDPNLASPVSTEMDLGMTIQRVNAWYAQSNFNTPINLDNIDPQYVEWVDHGTHEFQIIRLRGGGFSGGDHEDLWLRVEATDSGFKAVAVIQEGAHLGYVLPSTQERVDQLLREQIPQIRSGTMTKPPELTLTYLQSTIGDLRNDYTNPEIYRVVDAKGRVKIYMTQPGQRARLFNDGGWIELDPGFAIENVRRTDAVTNMGRINAQAQFDITTLSSDDQYFMISTGQLTYDEIDALIKSATARNDNEMLDELFLTYPIAFSELAPTAQGTGVTHDTTGRVDDPEAAETVTEEDADPNEDEQETSGPTVTAENTQVTSESGGVLDRNNELIEAPDAVMNRLANLDNIGADIAGSEMKVGDITQAADGSYVIVTGSSSDGITYDVFEVLSGQYQNTPQTRTVAADAFDSTLNNPGARPALTRVVATTPVNQPADAPSTDWIRTHPNDLPADINTRAAGLSNFGETIQGTVFSVGEVYSPSPGRYILIEGVDDSGNIKQVIYDPTSDGSFQNAPVFITSAADTLSRTLDVNNQVGYTQMGDDGFILVNHVGLTDQGINVQTPISVTVRPGRLVDLGDEDVAHALNFLGYDNDPGDASSVRDAVRAFNADNGLPGQTLSESGGNKLNELLTTSRIAEAEIALALQTYTLGNAELEAAFRTLDGIDPNTISPDLQAARALAVAQISSRTGVAQPDVLISPELLSNDKISPELRGDLAAIVFEQSQTTGNTEQGISALQAAQASGADVSDTLISHNLEQSGMSFELNRKQRGSVKIVDIPLGDDSNVHYYGDYIRHVVNGEEIVVGRIVNNKLEITDNDNARSFWINNPDLLIGMNDDAFRTNLNGVRLGNTEEFPDSTYVVDGVISGDARTLLAELGGEDIEIPVGMLPPADQLLAIQSGTLSNDELILLQSSGNQEVVGAAAAKQAETSTPEPAEPIVQEVVPTAPSSVTGIAPGATSQVEITAGGATYQVFQLPGSGDGLVSVGGTRADTAYKDGTTIVYLDDDGNPIGFSLRGGAPQAYDGVIGDAGQAIKDYFTDLRQPLPEVVTQADPQREQSQDETIDDQNAQQISNSVTEEQVENMAKVNEGGFTWIRQVSPEGVVYFQREGGSEQVYAWYIGELINGRIARNQEVTVVNSPLESNQVRTRQQTPDPQNLPATTTIQELTNQNYGLSRNAILYGREEADHDRNLLTQLRLENGLYVGEVNNQPIAIRPGTSTIYYLDGTVWRAQHGSNIHPITGENFGSGQTIVTSTNMPDELRAYIQSRAGGTFGTDDDETKFIVEYAESTGLGRIEVAIPEPMRGKRLNNYLTEGIITTHDGNMRYDPSSGTFMQFRFDDQVQVVRRYDDNGNLISNIHYSYRHNDQTDQWDLEGTRTMTYNGNRLVSDESVWESGRSQSIETSFGTNQYQLEIPTSSGLNVLVSFEERRFRGDVHEIDGQKVEYYKPGDEIPSEGRFFREDENGRVYVHVDGLEVGLTKVSQSENGVEGAGFGYIGDEVLFDGEMEIQAETNSPATGVTEEQRAAHNRLQTGKSFVDSQISILNDDSASVAAKRSALELLQTSTSNPFVAEYVNTNRAALQRHSQYLAGGGTRYYEYNGKRLPRELGGDDNQLTGRDIINHYFSKHGGDSAAAYADAAANGLNLDDFTANRDAVLATLSADEPADLPASQDIPPLESADQTQDPTGEPAADIPAGTLDVRGTFTKVADGEDVSNGLNELISHEELNAISNPQQYEIYAGGKKMILYDGKYYAASDMENGEPISGKQPYQLKEGDEVKITRINNNPVGEGSARPETQRPRFVPLMHPVTFKANFKKYQDNENKESYDEAREALWNALNTGGLHIGDWKTLITADWVDEKLRAHARKKLEEFKATDFAALEKEERRARWAKYLGDILNPSLGATKFETMVEGWIGADTSLFSVFGAPDWTEIGALGWLDEGLGAAMCRNLKDRQPSEIFIQTTPGKYLGGSTLPNMGSIIVVNALKAEHTTANSCGAKWFPEGQDDYLGYLYKINWYFKHPATAEAVEAMTESERVAAGYNQEGEIEFEVVMNGVPICGERASSFRIPVVVKPGEEAKEAYAFYDKQNMNTICIEFDRYQYKGSETKFPERCNKEVKITTTSHVDDFDYFPPETRAAGTPPGATTPLFSAEQGASDNPNCPDSLKGLRC